MDHVKMLRLYITNLMQALLKPQRCTRILWKHLVSRLLYPITSGVIHKNTLKHLDRLICSSVPTSLCLSSYTHTSYSIRLFHQGASVSRTYFRSSYLHRRKCSESLLLSPCPIIRICNLPITVHQNWIHSADEVWCSWSHQLYSMCNASRLNMSSRSKPIYLWFQYPNRIFPQRDGLLPTKVCRSRGCRDDADLYWRGIMDIMKVYSISCIVSHWHTMSDVTDTLTSVVRLPHVSVIEKSSSSRSPVSQRPPPISLILLPFAIPSYMFWMPPYVMVIVFN